MSRRNPEQTVRAARKWREDNPAAAEYMFSLALREVEAGRHFSFRFVFEQTRAKDFATVGGGAFKLPNEYAPIFARMFVAEHPGAERCMTLRKSIYDGLV